ncbi:MAG: hypothetical protein R2867_06780 [Caldilineaceae bacterium]
MPSRVLARLVNTLLPVFPVLWRSVSGIILLLALGVNPFEAYYALINGALGNVSGITQALTKATPLLLVGVGICIAFRSGVINIGGEGQIFWAQRRQCDCVGAANLAGWLLLP